MLFEELPVDVWFWLQNWLTGFAFCRLVLCGSARLNLRMFNSVSSMSFEWTGSTRRLGWPPMLQQFVKLRSFYYHTGQVSASIEYIPTVSDLLLLPASLHSIDISCDGAEVMFRNEASEALIDPASPQESRDVIKFYQFYKDEKDWYMIRDHLPELRKLRLHQYSVTPDNIDIFTPHFAQLPPKLQSLDLPTLPDLTEADLQALPPSLTHLGVPSVTLTFKLIESLPRSLKWFAGNISSASSKNLNVALWPPALRVLDITGSINKFFDIDDFWLHMPPLIVISFYNSSSNLTNPGVIAKRLQLLNGSLLHVVFSGSILPDVDREIISAMPKCSLIRASSKDGVLNLIAEEELANEELKLDLARLH